ncbi:MULTISPECIES: hypothetical protein [unclassified Pseudomonas]|uniref:hypothetical protein n=1 Tax=unclassified Pseudomonas TaxID=196821 RepID=UPI000A1E3D81|nr:MULTISPECIES: hypothetical protein [unclassified Pseudomonas]
MNWHSLNCMNIFSDLMALLIWYEQRLVQKFIFDTGLFDNTRLTGSRRRVIAVKMRALLLADPD